MIKTFFIALLLISISARKHHKEEGGWNPAVHCIFSYCEDEAFDCLIMDKECKKKFQDCNGQYGLNITPAQLSQCTKNDVKAKTLIQCVIQNCSSEKALMSLFED